MSFPVRGTSMRYEGKIWDEHVAQQLVQRCDIRLPVLCEKYWLPAAAAARTDGMRTCIIGTTETN
jgi:hypothetical protein